MSENKINPYCFGRYNFQLHDCQRQDIDVCKKCKEIKDLQDRVHCRNVQIADLRKRIAQEKENSKQERELLWGRVLEYLRNRTELNGSEIMKMQMVFDVLDPINA